jgi:tetratricopeptide (TPR) repeat protein
VALTGRFAALTQADAAALVVQLGGRHVSTPGRQTSYLVVGSASPPLASDGQPTASLLRARQLQACGYPLEIVSEDAFLARLGLVEGAGGIHHRYTTAQLSRILSVSRDRIRMWIRAGLIQPVETRYRLAFFDYQQVTTAKMLYDLLATGLPLHRIREGLQQIACWMPGMEVPLHQVSVLENSGRLLVRLDDGRLAEPSGQLQLEFAEDPDDASLQLDAGDTVQTSEEWFREALDRESEGDYEAAAAAYEQAISLDEGDPILHFNLGNVHYASQRPEQAAGHFRRAAELDAQYVEAWNNLGTVLADLQRYDESVRAFRQALAVFPLYADAHFNLGDVLARTGCVDEACRHWRQYLQLDPKSPWAEDVRHMLTELSASDSPCPG